MSQARPWASWARQRNFPNLLRAPKGFNPGRDWGSNFRSFETSLGTAGVSDWYNKGAGARGWRSHASSLVQFNLRWDLPPTDRRIGTAIAFIVNGMMKEAVEYAKANHQGWTTRKGWAHDSIRIIKPATPQMPYGEWGGGDSKAYYFLFLELKYGTLRAAQDAVIDPVVMGQRLWKQLVATGWAKPYHGAIVSQNMTGNAPAWGHNAPIPKRKG